MFQRILVPIDGSPLALRCAKMAVDLAKSWQCEIAFLFVAIPFDRYMHASGLNPITQSSKDELIEHERSHAQLAIAAAQAMAKEAKVKSTSTILFDKVPARAILQARLSLNADLVVMASHGYRGIKKFLLGSTANEVLNKIEGVPVMIYRDPIAATETPERDWEDEENETP